MICPIDTRSSGELWEQQKKRAGGMRIFPTKEFPIHWQAVWSYELSFPTIKPSYRHESKIDFYRFPHGTSEVFQWKRPMNSHHWRVTFEGKMMERKLGLQSLKVRPLSIGKPSKNWWLMVYLLDRCVPNCIGIKIHWRLQNWYPLSCLITRCYG